MNDKDALIAELRRVCQQLIEQINSQRDRLHMWEELYKKEMEDPDHGDCSECMHRDSADWSNTCYSCIFSRFQAGTLDMWERRCDEYD
jgi:hypothetical protein